MNDTHHHLHPSPTGFDADLGRSPEPLVQVGDVIVRRVGDGFGVFNYRGERVLDLPVRSTAEATRLAADIVSPWQGRVRLDDTAEPGGGTP